MISLIISVLDSIIPVNNYLTYLNKNMTEDIAKEFEFILIDDGSDIPLKNGIEYPKNFNFYIYETNDKRLWTQPAGRNFGANKANKESEYLLMTDIDHIITIETIRECLEYKGDKLVFNRLPAILNEEGNLIRVFDTLYSWGLNNKEELNKKSIHANTFLMRKKIFIDLLGGYDERFCGQYGGDDVDLNNRYGILYREGIVSRNDIAKNQIYYYPNPRKDIKKVFHGIRRKK